MTIIIFIYIYYFVLCNKWYKLPPYIYSVAIIRLGGFVQQAINNTIFGCLNNDNISISLFISSNNYYVIFGLNIFFIAI